MQKIMELKFRVEEADVKSYKRVDLLLNSKILALSRTKIQEAIKNQKLKINNKIITKSNYQIEINDEIEFEYISEISKKVEPENIKIDVVYEDDYLIAINKDSGIITHPAGIFKSGTLVNALLYYGAIKDDEDAIDDYEYRPGVVHRLDKDTSGLIIFAKSEELQFKLSDIFKQRKIEKKYIAVVYGKLNETRGIITYPIARHKQNRKIMCVSNNGKPAITEFVLKDYANNYSLLELDLKTGRTHQIRVHLKAINHPIVGDSLYSTAKKNIRLMLHSYLLRFIHPITNKELILTAPLKKEFVDFCKTNNLNIGTLKIEN